MIATLLMQIDKAKADWARLKKQDASLLNVTQEKLRATWTYHSNALEGNTLTLGETIFFLREGLTAEGKPLKDYLEAANHAEAIDYLLDAVRGARPLTPGLLKELNALLLKGIDSTAAMTSAGERIRKPLHPGEYKKVPNHVLTISGTIHHYVEPAHVPAAVEAAFQQYDAAVPSVHPLVAAADLHYEIVRIHPFDDCNGRVARLMMNLSLLRAGWPPSIIPQESRRTYLTALEHADHGQRQPFYTIVATGIRTTFQMYRDSN